MGPNAAWMRTHQECRFYDTRDVIGTEALRPHSYVDNDGIVTVTYVREDGLAYGFSSMEAADKRLYHDCKLKPSQPLYVGDNLAAYDDATVGLPRHGAPICGVVVGRDGPHVVIACRGSKLSFVVADGLSVEGLPQIEKPEQQGPTVAEIERACMPVRIDRDAIEDATYRGSHAATVSDALFGSEIGEAIATRALADMDAHEATRAAEVDGDRAIRDEIRRLAAENVVKIMRERPTGHAQMSEAGIYARQEREDRLLRKAPEIFPDRSARPIAAGMRMTADHFGAFVTRSAPPEPKPYPHVSEEDLLPDAGR